MEFHPVEFWWNATAFNIFSKLLPLFLQVHFFSPVWAPRLTKTLSSTLVANTEPCKAGRKSGGCSSGWVASGAHLSHSASGLSSLFCCMCPLQPSRNFGQITATSTILRDYVKLSFGWKKNPTNPLSSSGVEISIMLRDTVLRTAVRDVVTTHSLLLRFSLLLVSQELLTPSHSMVQNMFLLLCSELKHFLKNHCCCVISTGHYGNFPGGSVAKTPCPHCRRHGFHPWSGN